VGDLAHLTQITSGKFEGGVGTNGGLSWAPDGRIIYTSLSSGNADIWAMKSDGSDQKQLTADTAVDVDPVVSADGRCVVFVSNRGGITGLWRMDLDGGNIKMLSELDDHKPQISADSKWIIFDSWRSHKRALWKMPIEGGDAVQLTDKFTSSCGISPDDKSVACFYRADEQPGSPWRIMILPFDGGKLLKTSDVSMQDIIPLEASLSSTPDGRAITYISSIGGTPNLWSQPLDGGAPKKLTDFKENGVWRYAWSHGGKEIALSRGSVTSDVVLLKDFK
jgi:Tol biopolymer transport system component